MKDFPGELKQTVLDVIMDHRTRLQKCDSEGKSTLTAIVSQELVVELRKVYGLSSELDCQYFIVMGIHCRVNPYLRGITIITIDTAWNN